MWPPLADISFLFVVSKFQRYSIRQTKRLLHRKMLMTLDDDLREELRSIREAGNGPDFQEAIRKFAEKFGKNKKKNKSKL